MTPRDAMTESGALYWDPECGNGYVLRRSTLRASTTC